MMKPLTKHKYYVKCGELEQWVMAYDHTNAAVVAIEHGPGGATLETDYFFVSRDYIADIKERYYDRNVIDIMKSGIVLVPVDYVVEIFEGKSDGQGI